MVLFVERILPPPDHRVEDPGSCTALCCGLSAYRRQDVLLKYSREKDVVALAEERMKTAHRTVTCR